MTDYNSLSNTIDEGEGGSGDDPRIETIDVNNMFINTTRTGTLSGTGLSIGNNLGINNSLKALTTGFRNTMINSSGNTMTNSQMCTGVGYNNQALVTGALRMTTFGANNSDNSTGALDLCSIGAGGTPVVTGQQNTALGNLSFQNLTTGENNVGIGYNNSNTATTESQNTCMGVNANITAGNENSIALGYNALTTESNQFRVGDFAVDRFDLGVSLTIAKPNTTSISMTDNNPALTGTNTTLVGNDTGKALTTGTWNTAVGSNALTSCVSGDNNACFGMNAGDSLTGSNNTCVGRSAGTTLTSGTDNVCVGNLSDVATTTANSIAIGSTTTCEGDDSVAIGDSASCSATNSISLGSSASNANDNSCVIGNSSVNRLTLGSGTTSFDIFRPNATSVSLGAFPSGVFSGGNNLVIKGDACKFTTATDCTAIGFGAGQESLESTGAIALGRFALRDMQYNTNGLTDSVTGQAGVSSDDNLAIGLNCLLNLECGFYNVGVGPSCFNVMTGVRPIPPLTTPATIRYRNTGLGRAAGLNHNGNDCTFLGYASSATASSSFSNSTAIGASASITASNQIRMGNGSVTALLPGGNNVMTLGDGSTRFTEVFATNGAINTSDRNNKEMITETDLGLDFINDLKPVKYKWKDYSEEYEDNDYTDLDDIKIIKKSKDFKFNRLHHGLIAQEVKESMDKFGVSSNDFAGYIDTGENGLGLRYTEFIAPMIKAIQELSARVKELENR